MARGRPHKCPYCESTASVAKGFRYNKGGKVRLRRCKVCGRRWTAGSVANDQPSEVPAVEDPVPVPDEFSRAAFAHAHSQVEEPEETAGNNDETGKKIECSTELSLGDEGSPDQNDPGEEREEEAEETLFSM